MNMIDLCMLYAYEVGLTVSVILCLQGWLDGCAVMALRHVLCHFECGQLS